MKNTQDAVVRAPESRTSPAEEHRSVGAQRPDSDASTRQRVAQSILEHGPSTAAALAERLGLTAAAVRRHLDVLLERGHLVAREQRIYGARGRGRPAKVFALSDAGRADFYSAYDDLAISALEFLAEQAGPDAVTKFASKQAAALEVRYGDALAAAAPAQGRTQALAAALSADGYVASVQPSALGEQLCQHHCPVAHVAERFPQLCEVETELFSRLLGVHVQRLATIAHGDGICTTHVPHVTPASAASSGSETNKHAAAGAVPHDAVPHDARPHIAQPHVAAPNSATPDIDSATLGTPRERPFS